MNLFPTEDISAVSEFSEQDKTTVAYGKSWKFDFDKMEFVVDGGGRIKEADEDEAWIIWCYKALLTARYRYAIYSDNYGSELEEIIGRNYPKEVLQSEIERTVKETLLADPRTASVDNFSFEFLDDGVYFTCEVTNTRGSTATLTFRW